MTASEWVPSRQAGSDCKTIPLAIVVAARFRKKHGARPNDVHVSPKHIPELGELVNGPPSKHATHCGGV